MMAVMSYYEGVKLLHVQKEVAFWRSSFYPSNLKSFQQKALIGWKKTALQKRRFVFGYVNRLIIIQDFVQFE